LCCEEAIAGEDDLLPSGLFAAQGCSYKEMASLTDWAIVGNIATMDIRTGEPFDTAKLFSSEHLRKA